MVPPPRPRQTRRGRLQVDTIVRSEWPLRRYFPAEAQLWEYHSIKAERGTGVELGEAFSIFMRFQRRLTLAEKSAKGAKAELDRLRALRHTNFFGWCA